MKNNITIFKIWAPDNVMWAQWAKPAMFITPTYDRFGDFAIPEVKWMEYQYDAMVIVDLDGADSVKEGIALAQMGYRPVPLYNGVRGPKGSLVDVNELERSLYWGAEILERLNLKPDAKPVFLLDARRMKDKKHPGAYDNRWCVFPQDMPSADYLIKNGIKKIIVSTRLIQDDLSHVLCRYQEKGINIYMVEEKEIKPIKVRKPSRYKSFTYRLKVILGLKRNSAGGFGGYVPDPSQYHSGTGYYGIG